MVRGTGSPPPSTRNLNYHRNGGRGRCEARKSQEEKRPGAASSRVPRSGADGLGRGRLGKGHPRAGVRGGARPRGRPRPRGSGHTHCRGRGPAYLLLLRGQLRRHVGLGRGRGLHPAAAAPPTERARERGEPGAAAAASASPRLSSPRLPRSCWGRWGRAAVNAASVSSGKSSHNCRSFQGGNPFLFSSLLSPHSPSSPGKNKTKQTKPRCRRGANSRAGFQKEIGTQELSTPGAGARGGNFPKAAGLLGVLPSPAALPLLRSVTRSPRRRGPRRPARRRPPSPVPQKPRRQEGGKGRGSEEEAPPSGLRASAAAALCPPEPPAAPLRNRASHSQTGGGEGRRRADAVREGETERSPGGGSRGRGRGDRRDPRGEGLGRLGAAGTRNPGGRAVSFTLQPRGGGRERIRLKTPLG